MLSIFLINKDGIVVFLDHTIHSSRYHPFSLIFCDHQTSFIHSVGRIGIRQAILMFVDIDDA